MILVEDLCTAIGVSPRVLDTFIKRQLRNWGVDLFNTEIQHIFTGLILSTFTDALNDNYLHEDKSRLSKNSSVYLDIKKFERHCENTSRWLSLTADYDESSFTVYTAYDRYKCADTIFTIYDTLETTILNSNIINKIGLLGARRLKVLSGIAYMELKGDKIIYTVI